MAKYGVENVPDAPFQIINGVGQIPDADEVMGNDESIREWLRANALTALIPTGTILSYGGTTAPEGFLLCDGEPYDTTVEVDLFAVIAHAFGGSGGTFNVPDMRGRVTVGVGLHSDVDAVGEGDSNDAAVRTPRHQHASDHQHLFLTDPSSYAVMVEGNTGWSPAVSTSAITAGSSNPVTGLSYPSYLVVNSIIKG